MTRLASGRILIVGLFLASPLGGRAARYQPLMLRYGRLGASSVLLHHHPPYRLRKKRHRQLPSLVRRHLELVMGSHH